MKTLRTAVLPAFFIALFCVAALAGQEAPCGFDDRRQWLLKNDPDFARAAMENQAKIDRLLRSKDVFDPELVLTIPVVVHVIHLGEAVGEGTNITDAQIQSAIASMNEHYQNSASLTDENGHDYLDTNIRFCLAVRDPDDQPHPGINRVNGTQTITNYEDLGIVDNPGVGTVNETDVKALSRWPNTDYYNIWIVSEINNNGAGAGTQGYAYQPGASPEYDGAVILYNAFGTEGNLKDITTLNITVTHEVGHGLDLLHPFEGDSCTEDDCTSDGDRVCDTPPHTNTDQTCNVRECSGTEHIENYMDYADEWCQIEFSDDQTVRMRAALQALRPTLVASDGCVPVVEPVSDFSAPSPTCTGDVAFTDRSTNGPTAWAWSFPGGTPDSSSLQNPVVNYSTPGVYDVSLTATNSIGDGNTETKTGYLTVYASPPDACAVDTDDLDNLLGCGITSVSFDTIDHTTFGAVQDGGYQDFSCTHVALLTPGESVPITVTNGATNPEDVFVYIDYNNDGVFDQNGGELVFQSQESDYQHTGTVITPHAVVTDTVLRMRVISDWYGNPPTGPCTNQLYGQAEDYGIVFVPDAPPVSDFAALPRLACTNGTVRFLDLSTNGASSWDWAFEGGTPGSSTANSPTVTYNTPGRFGVRLTASNSLGSGPEKTRSGYVQIVDAAAPAACTPTTGTLQPGFHTGIANVALNTIDNTTGSAYDDDLAFGGSGYLDFSCTRTTKLKLGWTYPVSVTTGTVNMEAVSVYIDFNGNGVLEAGELAFSSDALAGKRSGNITVPQNAVQNTLLRMRVMSDLLAPSDACDPPSYGQVEDYGVIIGLPGDVDGDGDTTLADALAVLSHLAGGTPEDLVDMEADIDGNGRLDIREVIFIIQWVSGIR